MSARRSVLAGAIALFGLATTASAGPIAQLSIDHVSARKGELVLVVRALDGGGAAAEGLERGLAVRLDDHDVDQPQVRSPFAGRPPALVTVVIDGDLLQADSPSSEAIDALFHSLASGLDPKDQVHVLAVGRSVKQRDWPASELREGAAPVRVLAHADAPRLLDAIDQGLRDAATGNPGPARVLLVVTHARDDGSTRRMAELNADALRGSGLTSVNVLTLGVGGDAELIGRLERLATVTQGRLLRDGPAAFTAAANVVALANRYEVRIPKPKDHGDDHHRVIVLWQQEGRTLQAAFPYTDDMLAEAPWWASPTVWIVIVLGIGLLVLIAWLLQPRQVALLVVQGGEEDGQWYEIFQLPMRVGAREDNDILLSGPTISGVHCLLEREGKAVTIVDQGAGFGTFVNGERVTRRVLQDEDLIRLGEDVELVFEVRG